MNKPINRSLELVATLLLIAVTLMIGGFAVWDRLKPPVTARATGGTSEHLEPSAIVELNDSASLGDRKARVAIVLFSEFQCPFCARAEKEVLPQVVRRYVDSGKAVLLWRHYPLDIHSFARKASESTECAGRQGKFWQLHDWAFAHQTDLAPTSLRAAAANLDVDLKTFDACMTDESIKAKIDRDLALGQELGVRGTPTWFIGVQSDGKAKLSERVTGLGSVEALARAIDKVN